MKNNLIFYILILFCIKLPIYAQFSGGSGTAADPYQVATKADLNNIRNFRDKHFIQTANIIFTSADYESGSAFYNSGKLWEPIGNYIDDDITNTFSGTYDGQDYIIDSLRIVRNSEYYIGLFGYVSGNTAVIKNLGLTNANIKGSKNVGTICGKIKNGLIENCYTTGSVTGYFGTNSLGGFCANNDGEIRNCYSTVAVSVDNSFTNIGGFCGYVYNGKFFNCYSKGDITSNYTGNNIGGFFGNSNGGQIKNCYSECTITVGDGCVRIGGFGGWNFFLNIDSSYANCTISYGLNSKRIGGFIGDNSLAEMNNCYAKSNIKADSTSLLLGGFSGYNYKAPLKYCYSIGDISGGSRTGGLCGYMDSSNTYRCYSIGDIKGKNNVGGLFGISAGSYIDLCYSLGKVSGITKVAGFSAEIFDCRIMNCYTIGNVTGDTMSGGFCGWNVSGQIIHSYSVGEIAISNHSSSVGGFCGHNTEEIIVCFWDVDVSGITTSAGGIGKTTEEMKTTATYKDAWWDFTNIWRRMDDVNNDYPYFGRSKKSSSVYVSQDYNSSTSEWKVYYFNNLDTALTEVASNGTVYISNYNKIGNLDVGNMQYIVGNKDFSIKGNITNGLVQTTNNGKLILKGIPANIETTFPITDSTYNYTVTIKTANTSLPDIGINIIRQNINSALSDKFLQISGPINLNATIKFRIDKAAIPDISLNYSNFRYFDGTQYIKVPKERISVLENSDHYLVTVTGVNKF